MNGAAHYAEPIQIDVVTDVNDGTQPLEYSLKQNYPNPFNPTTTIEFSLPSSGFTTLKIFNLLGEEVASLVEGPVSAGRHTAQWNASTIPSGIYLYKLTANNFVETSKLVLMK